MARTDSHIIQKQSIEISFDDMEKTVDVQKQIAELFYERLEPEMNKLFDEWVGSARTATIDRLEIDCGTIPAKHWEEALVNKVLRKLGEQLRQVNKFPIDKSLKAADTFIYFLKSGTILWNSSYDSIEEMEEQIIIDETFLERIIETVIINPSADKRLIYQFSEKFKSKLLWKIIALKNKKQTQIDPAYPLDIEQIKSSEKDKLLLSLIRSRENLTVSAINKKMDLIPEKGKESEERVASGGLYINNAGLVLLHPFLPTLFGQLGFTNNNNWVDESSQRKAILILQYLADGQSSFPEYDLPLNKILCSCLPDEPVEKEIEIEELSRKECDELLAEVIRQWSRLKNTGIDALRETFLCRMGKLSRVDNGWLLQVEQKAVDILLGGLPWGIGIVKLPWMSEILYVEWT